MKRQIKGKRILMMTIIILAILILTGVNKNHQLNKMKVANNQIKETAVVTDDTTTVKSDATEKEMASIQKIESKPTVEPSSIITQTNPIITSSPNTVVKDQQKEDDEPIIDESKGNEYISEDDLIYSDKYIVTLNTIERITPKTTIEEFLNNITITQGNTVKILKGEEEITEGYIATGMKLQGSNGKIYEISVVGDLSGDGMINQIELTMIVRYVVGQVGYDLEGVYYSAGDITGDGEINIVDVSKVINYIVYEKWDYEEIETPKAPTIKVVGETIETEEYHKDRVEIQIIEDKTTANSKTTYKITGSKTKEETIVGEEEIIRIEGEGTYLVTAYTYGIRGNRSKGSNRIIKIRRDGVFKITLDNQGATQRGEEEIFERLNKGIYKEESLQTEMTTSKNPIEIPKKIYTINYSVEGIESRDVIYTFSGYYTQKEGIGEQLINEFGYITKNFTNTKFDEEATLYAKWTGGIIEKLPIPEKEGIEFVGWYEDVELTKPVEEPFSPTGEKTEITLYPKWTATLKVTLDNKNATKIGSQEIFERYNEGVYKEESLQTQMTTSKNPIEIPERLYTIIYNFDGQTMAQDVIYTFSGYYTEENGNGEQIIDESGYITSNFTNTKFNKETTLHAKWTGGTIQKLATIEKEGIEFIGWYEDEELTKPVIVPYDPTGLEREINLYPKWTATYKIVLDNQNATEKGSEAIFERYNQGIYKEESLQTQMTKTKNPITVPQRSYEITYKLEEERTEIVTYIFGGYYTKTAGNGEQVIDEFGCITDNFTNTKFNKETTLYAKWTGEIIEKLPIPEKEGFEFAGWYEDEELTKPVEEPYVITGVNSKINLYPKWEATLKITLDNQSATKIGSEEIFERYNEGVYKEESLQTQMTTTENPIKIPEREYIIRYHLGEEKVRQEDVTYMFGGYYEEENGNGEQLIDEFGYITNNFTSTKFNKEVTLHAKWTGGLETKLLIPEKEGFEFLGWYEDEEFTKPVEEPFNPKTSNTEIDLYAKWTATLKMTLDNQSATKKGSEEIFERFNIGIYQEKSLQTEMTTSENPIIVPQRNYKITYKLEEEKTANVTYIFGGYYTEENGVGEQLIDEFGYITGNFKNNKYNEEATLHAKWTLGTTEKLLIPEKEGFEFVGWYEDKELTKPVEEPFDLASIETDITLYPKWEATLKITLDGQNATKKASEAIFERYNKGIYKEESLETEMTANKNPIEKPERSYTITYKLEEGETTVNTTYAFGGYYEEENGNGEQLIDKNGYITENFTNTKFDKQTTIYAKWTGGTIEKLPIPEKEGYDFEGWYEDEELTKPVEEPFDPESSDSNITLYPKWGATFKVNLDNKNVTTKGSEEIFERYNRGIYKEESLQTQMTLNENPITVPQRSYEITYKLEEETTVNVTYTFEGYYEEENGNGKQLIDEYGYITRNFINTKFNKEATLYAKWTGGTIEKLPIPEKEGFEFDGWYEDEELTKPVEEPYDPTSEETEITLYPKWTATFKVNLDNKNVTKEGSEAIFERYNSGIYKEESLQTKMSTSENPIEKPERLYKITFNFEGQKMVRNVIYTFSGYYTEENGVGEQLIDEYGYITDNFKSTKFSQEVTLYAKWTGGVIEKLPIPEKEGYEFDGWYEDEGLTKPVEEPFSPTGKETEINLYPKWTATFKVNLDNKNATEKGSEAIFERYNIGIYQEESLKTQITTNENPIIVPQRSYNITYKLEEETTEEATYTFGGYYTEENGVGEQLIDESGYITDNFTNTKFDEEVTLHAKWTGGAVEKLPIPEKEGFEFGGWYEDEGLTKPVEEPFSPTGKETEINLYPKYTATFKINLDNQSATEKGNEELFERYGEGIYQEESLETKITANKNPIQKPKRSYTITCKAEEEITINTMYAFGGYYTEKNGNGEQLINRNGYLTENFTNTKFDKETTLYAKWTGGTIEKLPIPEKEGYEFEGWYEDEELTKPVEEPFDPESSDSNIILYPKWGATFKITLNDKNATTKGSEEIFERYNSGIYKEESLQTQITISENPIIVPQRNYEVTYNLNGGLLGITTQNMNYSFGGYYEEEDGSGKQLINEYGYITRNFTKTKFNKETTLYAKWIGGIIEKLPIPEREGFEFGGWYEDEKLTKPVEEPFNPASTNSKINLYAKWEATLKITLNNENATKKGSEEIYESYGNGIYQEESFMTEMTKDENPIEKPERIYKIKYYVAGREITELAQEVIYKFDGYYTEENGNGEQIIDKFGYITESFTNTKFEKETTLYVKWEGGTIEKLPIPVKNGYEFLGWYKDEEFKIPLEEPYDPIGTNSEIIIYPKFTATFKMNLDNENATEKGSEAVFERLNIGIFKEESLQTEMTTSQNPIIIPKRSYEVIYNLNGGSQDITTQNTTCNFEGYYTEENGGGEQLINKNGYVTENFKNNKYEEEKTLHIKWTGGAIEKLPTPSRRGYEFICWCEDEELTKPIQEPYTPVGENKEVNIYAKWSDPIPYTISYDLNGGELEEENPSVYTVETETIHLNKPIRAEYTFLGWIGSNGEIPQTEVTIEKGSIENKEYSAVWQENLCEILLDNVKATTPGSTVVYQAYKQGIYKEESLQTEITTSQNPITIPQRNYVVTYNTNGGTLEATTQNATYTFDGYYTQESGKGIQLITPSGYINSNFTTSKFRQSTTIHANWTGGQITLPTPTREGHTFAGWYTDANLTTLLGAAGAKYTPTGDLTLYAKWNINSYTVTYNAVANGGTANQTKTVQYKNEIDLTPTATKSGYTFIGWNTDKDEETALSTLTMGAKDVTLYAIYKKTVTLTFIDYKGTTKTTRKEEIDIYNNNEGSLTAPEINTYTKWTAKYWTSQTTTIITTSINAGADIKNIRTNTTYYAVYEQEVTGTFKYYNAQERTKSAKRLANSYNVSLATSATITAPGSLGIPTGYEFRGWSTSDIANASNPLSATAEITLTSDATYYASYQKTVKAKFYYASSTTSMSQTYVESEGTKYINYIGTTVNSDISIPQAVTSSKGPNNTSYKGISIKTNSGESVEKVTTANTSYYAYYEQNIKYYYYNGSTHTSIDGKRYARTDGTRYGYTTSPPPTPSAYDSATFKGWSTSSAEVKAPGDTPPTTLYAYYQKSVEATFNYYNGSASANTKASGTRTYISKLGGITTLQGDITVPNVVKQDREEFTYRGLNNTTTLSATTCDATTANTSYYAVYRRTMNVVYDANGGTGSVTSSVGNADMNYKGEVTSGDITVRQNICTKEGYNFMKWNTKADGTGKSYSAGSIIRNISFKTDLTLYAIWDYAIIPNTPGWSVSGSSNGTSTESKNFNIPEGYKIYYTVEGYARMGSGTAFIEFEANGVKNEIIKLTIDSSNTTTESGEYTIPKGGGKILMVAAGGCADAGSFYIRTGITKILRPDGSVYPLN